VDSRYIEYYRRTIDAYQRGLKLVGGGTGLGKTSAIPDVVKKLPEGKKAIYVANRIQLLEEVKKDADGISVLLPRDLDVVRNTILYQRDELYDLLNDIAVSNYLRNIDIVQLKKNVEFLSELFLNQIDSTLSELSMRISQPYVSGIMRDFRTIMQNAREYAPVEHTKLMKHKIILSLFPFISFKQQPQKKLLLVTLHKLFYGFFDGEKPVTATDLKDYVIFADEFDFLENNLIQLIAESRHIDDPFRFVELFYREMTRHKMQLENYPVSASKEIHERIDDILLEIDELNQHGIHYPEVNQFISTQKHQNVAIFFFFYLIHSKPIYLYQTNRGFNIATNRNAGNGHKIDARRLFTTVSGVAERILTLLKELEMHDPQTHRGLIADVYHSTFFLEQIRQVSQFPQRRSTQYTRLGTLLDAGFNVYDIHDVDKATDPEEVQLRHYAIYTTPEKFMATLAQNNLVFGLSATADIERCVNNFDFEWLGSSDGGRVAVIAPDDIDKAIIQSRITEKAQKRDNQLYVSKLAELQDDALIDFIERHFKNIRNNNNDEYPKNRVKRFFTTLQWIVQQPPLDGEAQSHLVFMNTFREVEYFFKEDAIQSNKFYSVETMDIGVHEVSVYLVTMTNIQIQVLFYNASKARQIQKDDAQFHSLFHKNLPVVVVTQYPSAGNGVNLQYKLLDGRERDFINIHLLEVPYYYFSPPSSDDTNEQRVVKLKQNLWYLSKLHFAKHLSESEFKAKLGTLYNPSGWNNDYREHPKMRSDYHFNTLSSLIQALGRIERVWEKMPEQHVILCAEAYHAFERLFIDDFEWFHSRRQPFNSHNLSMLLEQIEHQSKQQSYLVRRKKDEGLALVDMNCRDYILRLLNQFSNVRAGKDENHVRHTWEKLRDLALKHDFADDLLKDFVYTSPYVERGIVYMTADNAIVPSHLTSPDTRQYHLNKVYRTIKANEIIYKHFYRHGYQLAFDGVGQTFFTPYFYQAILAGAVGEEAIKALFKANGISLQPVQDEIFEVVDFQCKNLPFFIDCKHYSDSTLERYLLSPEDDGFDDKLNEVSFMADKVKKWKKLTHIYGTHIKLMVVNTETSHERTKGYYQLNEEGYIPVARFEDAQLIVIQGVLMTSNPNEYHPAFIRLLDDIRKMG